MSSSWINHRFLKRFTAEFHWASNLFLVTEFCEESSWCCESKRFEFRWLNLTVCFPQIKASDSVILSDNQTSKARHIFIWKRGTLHWREHKILEFYVERSWRDKKGWNSRNISSGASDESGRFASEKREKAESFALESRTSRADNIKNR